MPKPLMFKKGGKPVLTLGADSVSMLSGAVSENQNVPLRWFNDHMRIGYNGTDVLGFSPGSGNEINLETRYTLRSGLDLSTGFGNGGHWLAIRHSDTGAQVEVEGSGYAYVNNPLETRTDKPSETSSFTRLVYAPSDLNYLSDKTLNDQFADFLSNRDFPSRNVDLRYFLLPNVFYNEYLNTKGLSTDRMPLNAYVYLPKNSGNGPFPIILLNHGKGGGASNSAIGFEYLAKRMCANGYCVVSIDTKFLDLALRYVVEKKTKDGIPITKDDLIIDARAILMLEHLKFLKEQNSTTSSKLQNKLDFSRIMVGGHSKGGGAASNAVYYNLQPEVRYAQNADYTTRLDGTADHGLGPYFFNIRCAFLMAAVDLFLPLKRYGDTRFRPDVDVDVLALGVSRDEDAENLQLYPMYAAAKPFRLSMLAYLFGGLHMPFNESWDKGSSGYHINTLTEEQQRRFTEWLLYYFAEYSLKGKEPYRRLLTAGQKGFMVHNSPHVSKHVELQERNVEFLFSWRVGGGFSRSPGWGGWTDIRGSFRDSNLVDNIVNKNEIRAVWLDKTKAGNPDFWGELERPAFEVTWSTRDLKLYLELDSPMPVNNFTHFRFDLAMAPVFNKESGSDAVTYAYTQGFNLNTLNSPANFNIKFSNVSNSYNTRVFEHATVVVPDVHFESGTSLNLYNEKADKTLSFQTISIPLDEPGMYSIVRGLKSITFEFDSPGTGTVYLANIRFVHP